MATSSYGQNLPYGKPVRDTDRTVLAFPDPTTTQRPTPVDPEPADTAPPPLPDELERAVGRALDGAFGRRFPADPLLGASISHLVSASSSVVKRHGWLIETSILSALRAHRTFVVAQGIAFPITRAADREALAALADGSTAREVPLDDDVVRAADIDVMAVNTETQTAYALAVRRGGGATEAPKRQLMERNAIAVGALLSAYCAQQGYEVSEARVAILDYYGKGFPAHMRITREELDRFLGVPVVPTIEAMTRMLLAGYAARIPALLDRAVPPERVDLRAMTVAPTRMPLDTGSLRRKRRPNA